MDIKYNAYISSSANGPWTLVNNTPIDDVLSGTNTLTISGLTPGNIYYVSILGGYIEDAVFIPLINQVITPSSNGSIGPGSPLVPYIKVQI